MKLHLFKRVSKRTLLIELTENYGLFCFVQFSRKWVVGCVKAMFLFWIVFWCTTLIEGGFIVVCILASVLKNRRMCLDFSLEC